MKKESKNFLAEWSEEKEENKDNKDNIIFNQNKIKDLIKPIITIKILFFIIEIMLIISAVILYRLSLEKCFLVYEKCYDFFYAKIIYLLLYIFFSSIIFIWLFVNYIINQKYKKFVFLLIILILNFISDYGFDKDSHGGISIAIFFMILFFITFLFSIYTFLEKLYFKGKVYFYLFILISILLIAIFIKYKINIDKNNFFYGFNNERFIKNGMCNYDDFYINYYETFKIFNDFYKIFNNYKIKTEVDFFRNNFCKNCKYISFPQFKNILNINLYFIDKIQDIVKKNIKTYKDSNDLLENNKKDEVILDLSKNEPKLIINPIFNNDELKKKILDNKGKTKYNVISIFIDAVSRPQFFRKFNKLKKFLDENYFNDKNNYNKGYQFFRHHSLKPFTVTNWWAYRYATESLSANRNSIYDIFEKNGYETANFQDFCQFYENYNKYDKDILNSLNKKLKKQSFYNHDATTFFCNLNFNKNPFNMSNGQFSFFEKLIFGKRPFEYIFELSKSFLEKLKIKENELNGKIPFYQDLYFIDAHEFTQNNIEKSDEYFLKYFEFLKENNYLNNTVINIFSDHGNHMNFFTPTTSGLFERSNPMLFMLLPESLNKKVEPVIKNNQQKFVTLGDLNKTLTSLVTNENEKNIWKHYKNIFNEIIPDNRSCKDLDISEKFCYCKN